MIKNHYSTDIQSFKNALNLLGTSQEKYYLAFVSITKLIFVKKQQFLGLGYLLYNFTLAKVNFALNSHSGGSHRTNNILTFWKEISSNFIIQTILNH